jgi:CBS domain-containing protein
VNLLVQDVMTRQVVTVAPETPFKETAAVLRSFHITAVPVVGDRGLIGIVSEADLLDRKGETAADVMTSPAITIRPSATVTETARVMHRLRVKRLPVLDASKVLVGIVSRADLLKAFLRSDADIEREIVEQVLRQTLWIDPAEVDATVAEGVVTLAGELESKSLCRIAVRMTAAVPGVIEVHDRLTYRLDDSHLGVEPPPGSLHYSAPERAG